MKIKPWMESLSDVELGRVADATRWNYVAGKQPDRPAYNGDSDGCLMCHASGNRYDLMCAPFTSRSPVGRAEWRYIRYAVSHGDEKAGRLMSAMARAILARRKVRALPVVERKTVVEA